MRIARTIVRDNKIGSMGEARRRKEQGLAPKGTKNSEVKNNLLVKYPRLPSILIVLGILYLVFDLVKFYNR